MFHKIYVYYFTLLAFEMKSLKVVKCLAGEVTHFILELLAFSLRWSTRNISSEMGHFQTLLKVTVIKWFEFGM